jgi:hypothetical protein
MRCSTDATDAQCPDCACQQPASRRGITGLWVVALAAAAVASTVCFLYIGYGEVGAGDKSGWGLVFGVPGMLTSASVAIHVLFVASIIPVLDDRRLHRPALASLVSIVPAVLVLLIATVDVMLTQLLTVVSLFATGAALNVASMAAQIRVGGSSRAAKGQFVANLMLGLAMLLIALGWGFALLGVLVAAAVMVARSFAIVLKAAQVVLSSGEGRSELAASDPGT